MGSICRYSALKRFLNKYEKRLQKKYETLLLGKKIVSMDDVEVDYWVSAYVILDDDCSYNTHFRWATEDEADAGRELKGFRMSSYYKKHIIGRKIIGIEIGFDRDDMIYCYASVKHRGKIPHCIEIPIVCEDELEDYVFDGEYTEDDENEEDDEVFICRLCGEKIDKDEETLWGHIQMKHEAIFEEVQDWESPYMIEEYYEDVS